MCLLVCYLTHLSVQLQASPGRQQGSPAQLLELGATPGGSTQHHLSFCFLTAVRKLMTRDEEFSLLTMSERVGQAVNLVALGEYCQLVSQSSAVVVLLGSQQGIMSSG